MSVRSSSKDEVDDTGSSLSSLRVGNSNPSALPKLPTRQNPVKPRVIQGSKMKTPPNPFKEEVLAMEKGVETIYLPCSCTRGMNGNRVENLIKRGITKTYLDQNIRLDILTKFGYVPGTYMTPLYHNLLSGLIKETYRPYSRLQIILRDLNWHTSLTELAEAVQIKVFKSRIDKLLSERTQLSDFIKKVLRNEITILNLETPPPILNYLRLGRVPLDEDQTELNAIQMDILRRFESDLSEQMRVLVFHTPSFIKEYFRLGTSVGVNKAPLDPNQVELTNLQMKILTNLEVRSNAYIDSLNRGFREMIQKDFITPKQQVIIDRFISLTGFKGVQRNGLFSDFEIQTLHELVDRFYPNSFEPLEPIYNELVWIIQNPFLQDDVVLYNLEKPEVFEKYVQLLVQQGNEAFVNFRNIKSLNETTENVPSNIEEATDEQREILIDYYRKAEFLYKHYQNGEFLDECYREQGEQIALKGLGKDKDQPRYTFGSYEKIINELVDRYDYQWGTELTGDQREELRSMITGLDFLINNQIGYERIVAEGYIPGKPMSRIQAIRYLNITQECCHMTLMTPSSQPVIIAKHKKTSETKGGKLDKNPLTFDIEFVDSVLQLIPTRAQSVTEALAIAIPKSKSGKHSSTAATERMIQTMLTTEEQILKNQGYSNEKIVKHLFRLRSDLERSPLEPDEPGHSKRTRAYHAI